MGRLDGKVAIVTGGARGIGRAIVDKFAAEGAAVTFFDIDDVTALNAARELAAAGRTAEFRRADVTAEREVAGAISAVEARHGRVDVLDNNAGVNAYFDAAEMTEAEWEPVFAVDSSCSRQAKLARTLGASGRPRRLA